MSGLDKEIVWGLFRVIIVLCLMAPAVYAATRFFGSRQIIKGSMKIKEVLPLGNNRGLYVIEWEGTTFLLGVTPQNVTLLDKRGNIDNVKGATSE